MSLSSAQRIAFSGIAATQVQISVTSANISNADTKGYTDKTANQSSNVTAGVGTGVVISGITSNVDQLLLKSLIGANSNLGSANTANNYLTQLEQLYGTTSGGSSSTTGTSLANTLASFEAALSSLASTPNSLSLQSNAVSALNAVTQQLQNTSKGIQQLRSNADQDIASSVKDINSDLQQIASLNGEIKQTAAAGQSTADLLDQRNNALQDLSSMMNVSYFTASNGDLQVYSGSGQALVDTTAHTLSYSPASDVTAATTYTPGSSSGFSGITVNGVDITSQITSGNVGALITLRDQTLPNAQSQLDQLAQQLSSSVNAVSNQATAVPPPTSLTGSTTVSGTTPLSATGTVRLAVADQSGNLVSYQDINLASYSTVGALVSAINSGTSGVTASINSSGQLTLSASGSGHGVSINEMTSSVGSSDEGFSDYFGLNNLITGTNASNIAVRSDILGGASGLPTATLDSSSTLTVGNSVLASGSATVLNALQSAMTGSTNFAMAGGMGATTGSFTDYASAIIANVGSKASQATTTYNNQTTAQSTYANSLSSESGVNIDQETANLSSLQNKYAAAAQLIQAINTMFSALVSAMQAA
ncbi:flagellar hook-associated protein FlgK [Bradyrhizobium genosp. P]|uniref:flagellar hook-associated protein FlgK n=1 Tax=Bradyrhizobium genosp. P TaxID=83641 RepID=UPI003CF8BC49